MAPKAKYMATIKCLQIIFHSMQKSEVLDLADDIGRNEHQWIDYKQNYSIGGIAKKKAEFVRDIASLANTISKKKHRYILIGFDDRGGLVGIDKSQKDYSGKGPKHVFCYDESDIQEIIDSNLEPAPNFSYYEYSEKGDEFAALIVRPLNRSPCLTSRDINDRSGNRLLHEGLIFIRKGSGKKIAGHEELEDIIQVRIQQRREDILRDIRQVASLKPDALEDLSAAISEEDGLPVTLSDDADISFSQRLTRDPASNLDQQLNEDIAQWQGRGDDFVPRKAICEYYSQPGELTLDEEAILFLTQSAIKNHLLGIFWLYHTDFHKILNILQKTPDRHHRVERAAKIVALTGKKEWFENFMSVTSSSTEYGELRRLEELVQDPLDIRYSYLINNQNHQLGFDNYTEEFILDDLSNEETFNKIQNIGSVLADIQEELNRRKNLDTRGSFIEAMVDLELTLGKQMVENHKRNTASGGSPGS